MSLVLIPGATSSVQDPDGGTIVSGETACGTIDPNGDTDAFTFSGEAGQGVVIEMAANASDLGPAVYLYRPDGTLEIQVIGGYGDNRVAIREHQLEQTGTYTIVSSASWDSATSKTGEYCLSYVGTTVNNSPNIPSNPSPANHATGISISTDLSWSSGDADAEDTVTYDVYFGTSATPPFVETIGPYPATQSSITYDLPRLVPGATYHWQIVATDNHGATTSGPLWDFTTGGVCEVDILVVLQGGSRPPEGWEVPLTIKFFSPGADVMTGTPLAQFDLTTIKSGSTAVCQCSVAPGTYDVTAVSEHTLINVKRDVIIFSPSTAVNMGTLREGNANDDSIINISDFGILSVAYMKTEGEPGYDARADFDRNGIINISDFGLLAVNYMETSPIDISG